MSGKFMKTLDRVLSFFEEWTLFISVMAALIALFANVVLRYGFNYSLAWSEELVRDVIIYTTFIGCSVAVKNRSMIRIDAVVQIFPKLARPLTHFSNLTVMVFSAMMVYYGWQMVEMMARTHQKTIIMKIPLVYLYGVLPLMGVLMFLRAAQTMHQDFATAKAQGA